MILLAALALAACSKGNDEFRNEKLAIGRGKTLVLPVHKDLFFVHQDGTDAVTMSAGEVVTVSVSVLDGTDPQELAEKDWDKAKATNRDVSDLRVWLYGGPLGFAVWSFTVTEHGMRHTQAYRHVPQGIGQAVVFTGYWPASADWQFNPVISKMVTEMDMK